MCPQCGGPLAGDAPGNTVQCKFCGHSFQVTAPASAEDVHGFDPLPGLVVEGSWQTIGEGREIVPLLGRDRWLDWEPATGAFHVWAYDRSIGDGDPLPHAVASGSWQSIRSGHQLVSLGGDHVLDWEANSGAYRVWRYDSAATGGEDIFPTTTTEGRWQSIVAPARLVYLGDDKLLEWNPATGMFRIWHYDRGCQHGSDPLPGDAIAAGSWETIRSGHELVWCGDQLLDWVPETGSYRIFSYDRGARGDADPFPDELTSGSWESIRGGHRLIHLEGDRVLDWEPRTGGYRIWTYGR
jgi:hypothetical protein